jgi:hypothetical protein
MATNKIKRSIHLAQLQPHHAKNARAGAPKRKPVRRSSNPQPAAAFMPVKAHIYRAIADLNGGFELVMQNLKKLQQTNFLPSDQLAAHYDLVCNLRAEASRDLVRILSQRETANAVHFAHLCNERKKPTETPSAG